jgi:type I restriction enzyme S subunit
MSYLEKLLEGVEVEWKPLGGFYDYEQPTAYLVDSKNYDDNFPTPVLTAGKTFILGYTDETEGIYKASENPVIIFDDFTTANKWVDFDFKAKSSAMKMITSKNESIASLKYLYHWMNTLPSEFVDGDHKRYWISNYANKLFPIPCPNNPKKSLEIQQKIVAILDSFTKLTAELTAELTARKMQYSYYRDQLLSFDENKVEWKTLGEVAIYSRDRIGSDKLDENSYVGVDNLLQNCQGKTISTHVPQSGNSAKYYINDILIGNIRPYLKKIWLADRNGGTNGDVLIIHTTEKNIVPRFLYQILADDSFFEYNMQHAKGAKMPRGCKSSIMEYKIPIPSLNEQERIVSFLDKFDILTNSISEGLPKEIELRKKQYEYYRDLLLTFPKDNLVE